MDIFKKFFIFWSMGWKVRQVALTSTTNHVVVKEEFAAVFWYL